MGELARVRNVGLYGRDIDDGRLLAPGDEAKNVDIELPRVARLLEVGDLVVVEDPKPRSRPATTKNPKEGAK